jgi:hypothetical protein
MVGRYNNRPGGRDVFTAVKFNPMENLEIGNQYPSHKVKFNIQNKQLTPNLYHSKIPDIRN